MKVKFLLISLFCSNIIFAATNPAMILSNSSDKDSISVTLKISNAKNIQDIKFAGTESMPIVGREISFNSSSANESGNIFQSKLYLLPTKVESAVISVTANLDGKIFTSNKIQLSVNQQQLDALKSKQKKQKEIADKQMKEMQKQINEQIKIQQQFFNNINKLMLKQQQEISKSFK